MTKKHKYLLIFFAVIVLLFLNIIPSYALEIKPKYYPPIPFAPVITESSELPVFVVYFFSLIIYLGGIVAVISLSIGGVQLIFSSVSPEARNNAIDRIKGAILGLVLLVSSVIIIQTINPVLITPTLTSLPVGAGVFYSNGVNGEEKGALYSESDTSFLIDSGYNKIIYKCLTTERYPPDLLVWKFPEKDFGNYREATMARVRCGGDTSIDAPSFKMSFETPGVYFFLKKDCTGFRSGVQLSDVKEIEEPFRSEMQSVLIINYIDLKKAEDNINYGAILHREINFRGQCGSPSEAYKRGSYCHNITPPIASANIFTLNNSSPAASETSGNGAVFYSKPFGYKTGAKAGYFILTPKMIKDYMATRDGSFWISKPNAISFIPSYTKIDIPEEEKALCKTFEDCSGSIKIQGNYLAVLYAKELSITGNSNSSDIVTTGIAWDWYCQAFNKDVANLKEEEVTAVEGRKLDLIYIIPTK